MTGNVDRHPECNVADTARFRIGPLARLSLQAGCRIGDNVLIEIEGDGVVTVGRHVVIGAHCCLRGDGDIAIGDDACIDPNVVIQSIERLTDAAEPVRLQPAARRRTIIGRGAWIGANSTIAAGVHVADGGVVRPNSYVDRDVEPDEIAAGAPLRSMGSRTHTPTRLRIVFPIAVGFRDRPARCHFVARLFATMGNTLREVGIDSWYICHPAARSGLENVREDRRFIREDHRDFGELLDQIQPDVIFQWTGASESFQLTRSFAESRGIPIRYAELGWLPQSTTMYFDLEGTNARSSIRRLDLSTISVNPHLDHWLGEWRRSQKRSLCGDALHAGVMKTGYIFVPLQDERDTNITLASPYRTMDEFIGALSAKFPNERFLVRPHPHFTEVSLTPRPNVVVTCEGDLHGWLEHARAVVGINSTVLIESLAWDKPTHSVGIGLSTGLDAMYESDSVDNMTLHEHASDARRDRIRRLLSELIFVRQLQRKDLNYLDRLRHTYGVADLIQSTGSDERPMAGSVRRAQVPSHA